MHDRQIYFPVTERQHLFLSFGSEKATTVPRVASYKENIERVSISPRQMKTKASELEQIRGS